MAGGLKSRMAGWVRRAVGADRLASELGHLNRRLESLEGRLDGIRWPSGPVYLGDHEALLQTRWGAKMVVSTADRLLAPWLLMDGLWETHVTGWMDEKLRPGSVVVDVGANVGYFTLLAATRVGGTGRVVAVEAHPELFELLRRNVVMNGYRNSVILHQRAAWNDAGVVEFRRRVHYAANSSVGAASGLEELGDREDSVEVQSATLDEMLGAVGPIDMVKIDVEGAEVQALEGMAGTLERSPHACLMFEWSPEQLSAVGPGPGRLVELLSGWGYRFRLLERDLAPLSDSQLLELPYGNVVAEKR